MAAAFKPGDVVVLKSGGPPMTVDTESADGQYRCKWFKGAQAQNGVFSPAVLAKFTPPQK